MLLHFPAILSAGQVAHFNAVLRQAQWLDGRVTAGDQSGRAKRNLQVAEDAPEASQLGDDILKALGDNPQFMSAALPTRVYPPLFNRYGAGMAFGNHIDKAIRISPVTAARYRTHLSCTIFLTAPEDYDGGALVIEDGNLPHRVKLPAGDMVLYPASTVHRVEPVTKGERWASFFWIQSLVEDQGRRSLLHQLDQAIIGARADLTDDHPSSIALVGTYHNLIRMWAKD